MTNRTRIFFAALAFSPLAALGAGCSAAGPDEGAAASSQSIVVQEPQPGQSTLTRYDVQFSSMLAAPCGDVAGSQGTWVASYTFGSSVPLFCSFVWTPDVGTASAPDVTALRAISGTSIMTKNACGDQCGDVEAATLAAVGDGGTASGDDGNGSEGSVACAACVPSGTILNGVGYVILPAPVTAGASVALYALPSGAQTSGINHLATRTGPPQATKFVVVPPDNQQTFTVPLPPGTRPALLLTGRAATGPHQAAP